MLINFKIPPIVGILICWHLNIYERDNLHAQLSWTWKSTKNLKIWIIKTFLAFKLSDVAFVMLINIKIQTIVGILIYWHFNIYEHDELHAQLSWTWKSFIISRPGHKKIKIEPWHEISNNVVCATSKASDQPAYMRSLTRAFASRLIILWILSYWPNIIWSF